MRDKYQFPVYEVLLDPIQVLNFSLPVLHFTAVCLRNKSFEQLTFSSQSDPNVVLNIKMVIL